MGILAYSARSSYEWPSVFIKYRKIIFVFINNKISMKHIFKKKKKKIIFVTTITESN